MMGVDDLLNHRPVMKPLDHPVSVYNHSTLRLHTLDDIVSLLLSLILYFSCYNKKHYKCCGKLFHRPLGNPSSFSCALDLVASDLSSSESVNLLKSFP